VLASFTLEQENGLRVGSVVHVPFYASAQRSVLNGGGATPQPSGPALDVHVVGIEASEIDFPAGSTPLDELLVTDAFRRTFLSRTANSIGYAVRLRDGVSGLPHFDAEVDSLGALVGVANEDGQVRSIEASIHAQAIGWWILAAIAAVLGLAVLYQALARQTALESADHAALAALGANRRQLTLLSMVRNVMVGLIGAAGAVLLAVALSSFAPVGEARLAETSTGVTFDSQILPIGIAAIVLAVLVLGLWPALGAARPTRSDHAALGPRPSAVVAQLATAGAPPSALIGVRHALQRRSDGAGVPVGPAVLGTMVAVVALCGTIVFGASLSHLTATPTLYGNDFQLNFSPGQPDPGLVHTLEHDPAIVSISEGDAEDVSINRVTVGAVAGQPIRGPLLISTVAGHLPTASEVGLGGTTLRQLGAHLGSVVEVTVVSPLGGRRTVPFRVVSEVSLPTLGGGVDLGSGAVFTAQGYDHAACPPGPSRPKCTATVRSAGSSGILASVVPGPRGRAAVAHYLKAYQSFADPAVAPTSLVNFGEAVNFPLLVGGIVGVFGAATLIHLLLVSVSRRRRELGLLRVLGFMNRQVVLTVAWQATTGAVVGLVIGVPLGVIAGRAIWLAFASHLGVVPVAVVPLRVLASLVLAVLVVANVLAIAPAVAARRTKPGRLLGSARE
jgi:hypothetical protein